MSNKWRDNLRFNMKAKGTPRLVNKDYLDSGFEFSNTNIVNDAKGYFIKDPDMWRFPAKNYFVRICLAYYVADKYKENMYDLMNDEGLLPYDDAYSPLYDFDKETYDKIIDGIDIKNSFGYRKTIDVFGYLHDDVIRNNSITVGYNLTRQDFFDTICFKKKYISEFFFSLTHTMRGEPIDTDEVVKQFEGINTYSIPGNLVLNTRESQDRWEELIRIAQNITDIRAVTVVDIDFAKKVKAAFPELKIHISTHGATKTKSEELDSNLIEAVNVSEPFFYDCKELMKICKEKGIKSKFIANRGCILGKAQTMSDIAGKDMECCNRMCHKMASENPWMDLIRVNLHKESLQYYDVDLVKLSTRELPNSQIRNLLDYWTSPKPTQHLYNIMLNDNNYGAFLEWIKQRSNCDGDCCKCMKCKGYYEKMVGR